ncbi:MAG: alpha/beta fold hydrolase [Saprospiraceae bacterium]
MLRLPAIYAFLTLFLFISLTSCQKEELFAPEVRHDFWLKNAGSEMPVTVSGNTASKTFLLFLHGGPNGSMLEGKHFNSTFFEPLEEKYAVVYWDQRHSGLSRNSKRPETATIEEMVDDLEQLVQIIQFRYGEDIDLYLVGISWGGYYGFSYLLENDNQSNIKGFINIAGIINANENQQQIIQSIQTVGAEQLAAGNSVEQWTDLLADVIQEQPDSFVSDDNRRIQTYTSRAEQLLARAGVTTNTPSDSWYDAIFNDSYHPFTVLSNKELNPVINAQLYQQPLNERLKEIEIPTKLIYGKYDVRTPLEANALPVLEQISTPEFQKSLTTLDKSGHFILQSEPQLAAQAIVEFVEAMR